MNRYLSSRSEIVKITTGLNSPSARNSQTALIPDTLQLLVDFVSESWDDFTIAWMYQNHSSHTYDPEGRLLRTENQSWFMNGWQNNSQFNYQYDGVGVLRRVLIKNWNGGSWVDNYENEFTYDAYGNVTGELHRVFNGSGWTNVQKYSSWYDSTGRVEEVRNQTWSGSAWQNQESYLFLYTGAGQIEEVINRVWIGEGWVNNLRDSNSYDGSGNQRGALSQYWAANAWNDDTRTLADYDVDNLLVETVEQSWGSSSWLNELRRTFNNDMEGHPTEILIEYWDGVDWSNDGILYHTYDGPNIVEDYYVSWDGLSWVGRGKVSYLWESIITPDQITQKYPVNGSWNLVSVPLSVTDYEKTTLFPTSSSSAFTFDAGYTAATTLENGRGYWIKFDSDQTVTMAGTMRTSDTIDVVAGWNLVGSLSAFIPASGVGSIPGGLVVSGFFGFNAGYQASEVIQPGKAYWVKVAEAGQLIMSSTEALPAAARVRMQLTGELPPPPPGTTDESMTRGSVPLVADLGQNYPNPFNPLTRIAYTLSEPGHVRLSVFNVIGHEVAVLVDGTREGGSHSVNFDAAAYPSGVYFYKISTPGFSGMKRMILLK